MTYEKLRYIEQLLSNIYTEGLTNEKREKIELYFEENYGEDSLVKPISVKNTQKEKLIKQLKRSHTPDNLQDIITRALMRNFEEIK